MVNWNIGRSLQNWDTTEIQKIQILELKVLVLFFIYHFQMMVYI